MFSRLFRRRPSSSPSTSVVSEQSVKKRVLFTLDKRQKFILSVFLLSLIFFCLQFITGQNDLILVAVLAALTDVLLFWAMRKDLKGNFLFAIFLLPFFYSLAFGFFFLLIPTRLLFRLVLTVMYGLGLYSLFLSQNIFVVAAIRTIALLTGARIVSFVITIFVYLFLVNTILSFHLFLPVSLLLLFMVTWALCYHSLWTYSSQKIISRLSVWAGGVSICLTELASVLLFWPSSPTVLALFLSSVFYVFTGLSHVWMERRLFKNVLWEFTWIIVIGFLFLFLFTSWGK